MLELINTAVFDYLALRLVKYRVPVSIPTRRGTNCKISYELCSYLILSHTNCCMRIIVQKL